MKIKLDENVPIAIADLLRSKGYDAVTVYEENLSGGIDENRVRIRE